jgi:hypothetical protein
LWTIVDNECAPSAKCKERLGAKIGSYGVARVRAVCGYELLAVSRLEKRNGRGRRLERP